MLCAFYLVAGLNHFWHPQAYLDLIPPYLPAHSLLNEVSGAMEMTAALLMFFGYTRQFGAILLMAMLVAFVPAHIYMIQLHGCVSKILCVPEWVAWVRLLVLQPLLILWAWKTYKWNIFSPGGQHSFNIL